MATGKHFTVKHYISSPKTVIRCDAQQSLGSALSLVHSGHEAVFVFDKDEFIGLVSPFKTLYHNNYPHTTKVLSIVVKPPLITEDSLIYDVVEHMLSTKMYVLPVFTREEQLQGVVHGKDILKELVRNADLLEFVSNNLKPRIPITAPVTSTVQEVFHKLKNQNISRIVLVDQENRLNGIVARSDLLHSLIKPTAKMRFSNEGTHVGYYSLAGEKKFRKEESVRRYSTALVNTLPDTTPPEETLVHLVNSPYNSVVLIDKQNKPTGFLSTRDILQTITYLRPEEDIPLIIKNPSTSVSDKDLERAKEHLIRFGRKIKQRMEIKKIEVVAEEPKNSKGQTRAFNVTIVVTPIAGKAFVTTTKKEGFVESVIEATSLIEKQRRRRGSTKKKS